MASNNLIPKQFVVSDNLLHVALNPLFEQFISERWPTDITRECMDPKGEGCTANDRPSLCPSCAMYVALVQDFERMVEKVIG